MSAEHGAQRFRVGEVPPLAEGYTDRPDTARGILEALVPGATLALVPGSAFAEGPSNWLGACGKTQIAVIVAESLWRSTATDALIWISATSREAVLSAYVEASGAAFGIAPTGTAESVAARLVSWLATTDQRWMIVLDDLQDQTDLDGLWPEGPSGRVLVTSMQASLTSGRRGIQVIPVGFFSIREALNCLTERLSVNPVQRHGAIDLIEALGREPLALAQAASVVANSTLACRDYRDYFARRRQQIGVAAGEVPSAAAVTWTLSLGQAESLLPGASVRLMLVLVALFDGHGIPGAVFSTSAVSADLGGAATQDRKSTRLNSSHPSISYAGFCVKKKNALRNVKDAQLYKLRSLLWAYVHAPDIHSFPTRRSSDLSLGQAESLLPGASVRLMLVLVALFDGHGIPGAVFSTSAVSAYLGGAATPFSAAVDPKPAWDALLAIERAGLVSVNRAVSPPTILVNSVLQAAIRLAAPANVQEPAARAAANALLEIWPVDEAGPWTAAALRLNAAALHDAAPDVLWADGCHPLLLRAGRSLDDARLVGPAVEYWRDLSARCDTKLMPGHPDALVVAAHLAAAYLAAGYASEAVHWYQRVLAERGRELAPGHPAIIAARVNLAKALVLAGEPADAVTVLLRAVS